MVGFFVNVHEVVNAVRSGLDRGKSRHQLADECGMPSMDALDQFMRRHQYDWYPSRGNYFPNKKDVPADHVKIILHDLRLGVDLREIATKLQFSNVRQMAQFMKEHGYVWSEQQKNYILLHTVDERVTPRQRGWDRREHPLMAKLEKHLPLLELLDNHREQLLRFIASEPTLSRAAAWKTKWESSLSNEHTPLEADSSGSDQVQELLRGLAEKYQLPASTILMNALHEFEKSQGAVRD
jgi:hypothetical protein